MKNKNEKLIRKILEESIDYSNKLMKEKIPEIGDNYYNIKHDGIFVNGIKKAISLTLSAKDNEVEQAMEEFDDVDFKNIRGRPAIRMFKHQLLDRLKIKGVRK